MPVPRRKPDRKFFHMGSTPQARLRLAIHRAGLSIKDAALGATVSDNALRGALNGADSALSTWKKLARFLNVSLSWLIEGIEHRRVCQCKRHAIIVRVEPDACTDNRLPAYVRELKRALPGQRIVLLTDNGMDIER